MLYKKIKKEVSIQLCVYRVSFQNSRLYNGLKQIRLYHHKLNHKLNKEEIQTWLSEYGDIYGITMKKIKEFFSQSKVEHEKLLLNLTRDCWVTDNEIERLFSILNKQ